MAALRGYSLVEVTGNTLTVHRLVQAVTRDGLTEEERRRWAAAAVALLNVAFPYDDNDPATWALSRELLAHALTATGHAEALTESTEGTGRLLNHAGNYFGRHADYGQAGVCYERALRLAEAAFGPDHLAVATAASNLGLLLQDQGDLVRARAYHERVIRILDALGELAYSKIGSAAINNLGLVLQAQGNLAGAQICYEQALRIDEAAFGPDHLNVAIRISNFAAVLRAQNNLAGAQACCERALKIAEAAVGPNHPDVAVVVNNLGEVLRAKGDLTGARAWLERALRIDEAALSPNHPNVAIRLVNLGGLLVQTGERAAGIGHLSRALAIFERFFAADHPYVVGVRQMLCAAGAPESGESGWPG